MSTPSHILTNTKFGTTVTFKLYGAITPERLAAEQRLIDHRAEQVGAPRTHSEKTIVVSERRPSYHDEDVFDGPFQSTGR